MSTNWRVSPAGCGWDAAAFPGRSVKLALSTLDGPSPPPSGPDPLALLRQHLHASAAWREYVRLRAAALASSAEQLRCRADLDRLALLRREVAVADGPPDERTTRLEELRGQSADLAGRLSALGDEVGILQEAAQKARQRARDTLAGLTECVVVEARSGPATRSTEDILNDIARVLSECGLLEELYHATVRHDSRQARETALRRQAERLLDEPPGNGPQRPSNGPGTAANRVQLPETAPCP